MIIDLTQPLDESTPVYPGDPKTKIEKAGDLDVDGYYDSLVSLGTHVGTHIDAPVHMLKDGKHLKDYSVEKFVGRGRCIKVIDNIFKLKDVEDAGIEEGDIVLFHTGMSDVYTEPKYFEDYPQIPEDIAQALIDMQVKMVGVDMASPDYEPFPIHKLLLANDILIAENLTNLASLADKKFTVYALPISLQDDAAPARIIAKLN